MGLEFMWSKSTVEMLCVVGRADLGVAEEDVVVGLPVEDVLEEVQLEEVQVDRARVCGVVGWRGPARDCDNSDKGGGGCDTEEDEARHSEGRERGGDPVRDRDKGGTGPVHDLGKGGREDTRASERARISKRK